MKILLISDASTKRNPANNKIYFIQGLTISNKNICNFGKYNYKYCNFLEKKCLIKKIQNYLPTHLNKSRLCVGRHCILNDKTYTCCGSLGMVSKLESPRRTPAKSTKLPKNIIKGRLRPTCDLHLSETTSYKTGTI